MNGQVSGSVLEDNQFGFQGKIFRLHHRFDGVNLLDVDPNRKLNPVLLLNAGAGSSLSVKFDSVVGSAYKFENGRLSSLHLRVEDHPGKGREENGRVSKSNLNAELQIVDASSAPAQKTSYSGVCGFEDVSIDPPPIGPFVGNPQDSGGNFNLDGPAQKGQRDLNRFAELADQELKPAFEALRKYAEVKLGRPVRPKNENIEIVCRKGELETGFKGFSDATFSFKLKSKEKRPIIHEASTRSVFNERSRQRLNADNLNVGDGLQDLLLKSFRNRGNDALDLIQAFLNGEDYGMVTTTFSRTFNRRFRYETGNCEYRFVK
ncbi:hypothetical protein EBR96_09060 [bacterium]|nr:hypothetical protein [bacterium]